MTLIELERQFEPLILIGGGVRLLAASDALRYVELCELIGVDVEGLEGFKVFGAKIQPCQEHSFDLFGKREHNHEIAKQFIVARLNNDLWFEVGTAGIVGEKP